MAQERIQVSELVTSGDVKEIHYQHIQRGLDYAPGHHPMTLRKEVKNIRDGDINQMLRAANPFSVDEIPEAWGHNLAVFAGRHKFPDANHRTGFDTFNLAISKKWNVICSLTDAVSAEMVHASKEMRRLQALKHGFYTVGELADPKHPYRKVFQQYEPHLKVTKLP